jgi:hypothetical protein
MKTKYVYKSSDSYFFSSHTSGHWKPPKSLIRGKKKNANLPPLPSGTLNFPVFGGYLKLSSRYQGGFEIQF